MDQAEALVQALKRRLKARGVTYAQLARDLDLSEASVKRVFASGTMTLERLGKICEVLGMSFQDLARDLEPPGLTDTLTPEQEETLASDPALLSVFYLVLNGLTVDDVVAEYELTRAELTHHLVTLDRAKLIELHPHDVIRPLVSRHARWTPDGTLARTYVDRLRSVFFDSSFSGPGELQRFVVGRFDEAGLAQLERKVARLLADYEALDSRSEVQQASRQGICLVIAYRPFSVQAIGALRRRSS